MAQKYHLLFWTRRIKDPIFESEQRITQMRLVYIIRISRHWTIDCLLSKEVIEPNSPAQMNGEVSPEYVFVNTDDDQPQATNSATEGGDSEGGYNY